MVQSLLKKVLGPTPGQRIGVAVSGGADSVALLLLLLDISRQQGLELPHVLHVDHGLRPDSASDRIWVEALARSLNLPFHSCRLVPPDASRIGKEGGIEAWGRRERLRFFAAVSQAAGLAAIATGHHLLDQAETLLLRLMRGTSCAGLRGIRPRHRLVVRGTFERNVPEMALSGYALPPGDTTLLLWRPLLKIGPEELRAFLRERRQDWREDVTNQDTARFLRNRVRAEVIPLLEACRPGTVKHLMHIAQDVTDMQADVARRVRKKWNGFSGDVLEVEPRTPPIILRELLRRWWLFIAPDQGDRFDRKLLSRLVDLVRNPQCGRRIIVAKKTIVRVSRGLLLFHSSPETIFENPIKPAFEYPVCFAGKSFSAKPGCIIFALMEKDPQVSNPRLIQAPSPSPSSESSERIEDRHERRKTAFIYLPPEISPTDLEIRHPLAGDRIAPSGGMGHKRLSRFLIDRKIPVDDRLQLVVIAHEREILWVLGTDHACSVSTKPQIGWWTLQASPR
ncbi:MAG: tRNA lysidine(34) synthetase TilS [Candidatus Ozemobacteraceae bacterium]